MADLFALVRQCTLSVKCPQALSPGVAMGTGEFNAKGWEGVEGVNL